MKEYLSRFKNVGTVLSLIGLIGLLLLQFGFKVDLVWLDNTGKIICSILVILGICNNPTTSGVDLPAVKKEDK